MPDEDIRSLDPSQIDHVKLTLAIIGTNGQEFRYHFPMLRPTPDAKILLGTRHPDYEEFTDHDIAIQHPLGLTKISLAMSELEMLPLPMPAKPEQPVLAIYNGKCAECKGPIKANSDKIVKVSQDGPPYKWQHAYHLDGSTMTVAQETQ